MERLGSREVEVMEDYYYYYLFIIYYYCHYILLILQESLESSGAVYCIGRIGTGVEGAFDFQAGGLHGVSVCIALD